MYRNRILYIGFVPATLTNSFILILVESLGFSIHIMSSASSDSFSFSLSNLDSLFFLLPNCSGYDFQCYV